MLHKKKEIVIVPFYKCNLSCKFCYNLGKDQTICIDFDKTFSEIKNLINNSEEDFNLILYGGELLADFIGDNFFRKFEKFLLDLNALSSNLTFKFTSNLIHLKRDRWAKLFHEISKRNKLHLRASFDFFGRFSVKDFEIFKENVTFYKPYLTAFSMVLTKQNIELFYKDSELRNYFNILYKDNFRFRFVDYVPNSENYQNYLPTLSDLSKFYQFLIEHYPKIDFIKKLENILHSNQYDSEKKLAVCQKPVFAAFYPDGTKMTTTCLFVLSSYKYCWNLSKKAAVLKRNQLLKCFACKFYKNCDLGCPASFLFNSDGKENCPIKTALGILEQKKCCRQK